MRAPSHDMHAANPHHGPVAAGTHAMLSEPYCGSWRAASPWYTQWNADVAAWVALAVLAAAALAGIRHQRADMRRARLAAVGVAALLWLSPLCALSATLLTARVAHHLLLMLVLAPLLAAAWPGTRARLPMAMAAAMSAAAMAAWFVPAVYTAAWRSDTIYWLLQAVMLGAAWQFWRCVGARDGERNALASAAGLAVLALVMGLIGAVLTFAPQLLLLEHALTAPRAGVDALADQRLAGLSMWTLGMAPLAVVAARAMRTRLAQAWQG